MRRSRAIPCAMTMWLLGLPACQEDRSHLLGPSHPESAPGPSLAATAVGARDMGTLATAHFNDLATAGCIVTDILVVGSEGRAKQGRGAPTPVTAASVSVVRHNGCTGLDEIIQGRTSTGVLFRSSRNTASLRATIPAEGRPGVVIRVDLVWDGRRAFATTSSLRRRTPGAGQSQVTQIFTGASGTVSVNGINQSLGEFGFGSIEHFRMTSGQPDTGPVSAAAESDLLAGVRGGPWVSFPSTSATAQFSSFDRSGCIESLTTVQGFVEPARPKFTIAEPGIDMFVFQINHCTGTSEATFFLGFGGERMIFRGNGEHQEARLQGSFLEDDFFGEDLQIDVNVAWTADQLALQTWGVDRDRGLDCRFTEKGKGTIYNATARGTVRMNGTNLSPEPAVAADISHSTDRQRSINGGCIDD